MLRMVKVDQAKMSIDLGSKRLPWYTKNGHPSYDKTDLGVLESRPKRSENLESNKKLNVTESSNDIADNVKILRTHVKDSFLNIKKIQVDGKIRSETQRYPVPDEQNMWISSSATNELKCDRYVQGKGDDPSHQVGQRRGDNSSHQFGQGRGDDSSHQLGRGRGDDSTRQFETVDDQMKKLEIKKTSRL